MDNQAWFEEIYNRYADFLYRVGRRFLNSNDDEDILYDAIQESFLALWDKREQLIHHPNIGGWLVEAVKFRILGGRSKTTRRSAHHAFSLDDENALPMMDLDSLSPEQNAVLVGHIEQLTAILGEENAKLFLAYTLDRRSAQELAAQYSISESCVWMRISRLKKKLSAHPELFYLLVLCLIGFPVLNA